MIADLRFIERDGKRILQAKTWAEWEDVPLVVDEKKVEITRAQFYEAIHQTLSVDGEKLVGFNGREIAHDLAKRLGLEP